MNTITLTITLTFLAAIASGNLNQSISKHCNDTHTSAVAVGQCQVILESCIMNSVRISTTYPAWKGTLPSGVKACVKNELEND